MSVEDTLPFQSSTGVLGICILIKDVLASLTSSQQSFTKHQDIVRELLSLDRVLLQVELSSANLFLYLLKDKAAPTIDQIRYNLVAFLENCKRNPALGRVGCPDFISDGATANSALDIEQIGIENFLSAVNKWSTDLNTLLALESNSYPIGPSTSQTEDLCQENPRQSPPQTPSFDLEDKDEVTYVRPAPIQTDESISGLPIHEHNPYEDITTGISLIEDSSLENDRCSVPSIPSSIVEENEVPTPITNTKDRLSRKRKLRARGSTRRATTATQNRARDHHLYKNASTGPDGLYHCPLEGKDPLCSHEPRKEKCYYFKFVDAHMKPYHCEVKSCENKHFSSVSILFRHQREAHGMHGVSKGLHLCPAPGCHRGSPGKGFSRYWNLVNHMKLIHRSVKTDGAGPGLGCTNQCSDKLKAQKMASAALADSETVSASPSIDLLATRSRIRVEQPRSEPSISTVRSTLTNSPLGRLIDALTHPHASQTAHLSNNKPQVQTHDHVRQSSIQRVAEIVSESWHLDPNLAKIGGTEDQGGFEQPLEDTLPTVGIYAPVEERHQGNPEYPKFSISEDGLPVKKPRCSRSKNGCYTCRKRKIKCDETHPTCGACTRMKLECNWPDSALEIILSKAQREYKDISPRELKIPHAMPSSTEPQHSLSEWNWNSKSLENGNLITESYHSVHQEQAERRLNQDDVDDSDTRLLHLLQASLQDG